MKRPWAKNVSDTPRRRQQRDDTQVTLEQSNGRSNALFRRNRTLIGSLSASVTSANELGGDLRSPRAHIHHLNAHRRRLGSFLIIVLTGVGSLTWLLYEFTAGIQITPTTGSVIIQVDRYQRAINDYFAEHPFERIRLLLNEKQLNDYLVKATPEIAAVHVNGAAGLAMSQFDVTFRRPLASWLINSEQYYVDKDGVPFRVNYFERPTVKILDQSGVPQTTGTTIASSRFLYFVGRAVELARVNDLTVEQAIIPASTTRQIELKVVKRNYPIKLSLDRPVGEQIEDMSRTIAYFDTHNYTPQYIDVRVSGKAFYK